MKQPNRNKDTKEVRQIGAANRNAEFAALSIQQKIAHLDARLGVGVGATKQRAKLAKALKAPEKKPEAPVVAQDKKPFVKGEKNQGRHQEKKVN